MSKNNEKQTQSKGGDYYARRPIEEIKAFKSKDGKSFVVQVIKTCIFPINYAHAIVTNESPYKDGASEEKVSRSEQ
tara:strand:- start:5182 stop:5409 length:228 start_codon:yes stop_codon:yes gene_type:complete